METIFDCFFDETFLRLTRNGLQTKQNRKDVIDHLNSVISGCCDGQNLEPCEAGRYAVVAAVKYHQRMKNDNGDICMMGKYHNILYVAMKVCWDWGIKDSTVVSLLLEEIYSCEKTFERLFLGALFGPNAPHFIAGWRSDFKDQDENSRAMVYYLEHSSIVGLEFPVVSTNYDGAKMIRFIDIPIESCGQATPMRVALQATAPDILMILLRFGADPKPYDGGIIPVIAVLNKLLDYEDRRYPYQLEACFKILMRAIPYIEMPYKPYTFKKRKELFLEKYFILFKDGFIKANQVFGVSELKHLCRIAIRERLRVNCQLPNGINTLLIPRSLKRYVDLMEE